MTTCTICRRPLDTGDVLARDCGGDCYACILKCEHSLPGDIEDTRLRDIEPILTMRADQRIADAITKMERMVADMQAMLDEIKKAR